MSHEISMKTKFAWKYEYIIYNFYRTLMSNNNNNNTLIVKSGPKIESWGMVIGNHITT